jgi:hypothetical protein
MAPQVANNEEASDDGGSKERMKRQRRTGVYEIKNYQDGTIFQSVKLLRENYMAMLHRTVESFRKEGEARGVFVVATDERLQHGGER